MQLQLGMEFFHEKGKERPCSSDCLQCFNTKWYHKVIDKECNNEHIKIYEMDMLENTKHIKYMRWKC